MGYEIFTTWPRNQRQLLIKRASQPKMRVAARLCLTAGIVGMFDARARGERYQRASSSERSAAPTTPSPERSRLSLPHAASSKERSAAVTAPS